MININSQKFEEKWKFNSHSSNYIRFDLIRELPDDKDELEKMQIDIEEVFSKELFFTAFNQSEYFDRLKEESVSITDIPLEMKSEYANELMYLKCKILLKLDKNEEYNNELFDWSILFGTVKPSSTFAHTFEVGLKFLILIT